MNIIISIAGLPMSFRFSDRQFAEAVESEYRAFISEADAPLLCMEVAVSATHVRSQSARPGVECRLEGKLMRFSFGRSLDGFADLAAREGTMRVLSNIKIFDAGLRILISHLLLRNDGVLIHGAAIESDRRGYLFYGPSETGKTTISRISARAGKRILSDELTAVRRIDGRYIVFGTPFWGEFRGESTADGIELSAMMQPIKSDRPAVKTSDPADTAHGLLKTIVNFSADAESNCRALDAVADLTARVGSHRLFFSRTGDFWPELN
jgi:hypothetical protein